MTKKLTESAFFSLIIVAFVAVSYSACKKDQSCDGVITVVSLGNGGAPEAGAFVRLWANITGKPGQVEASGITDGSGKAYFNFKLQAIFNVDVTGMNGNGQGIIKLEPGKKVESTVEVP